ncbi:MAG TPA: endolytic transglycosylase MltG, partial [Chthonomonadaceae bacterium]|nr:endolytic transglycosylase MltG [Chthonomonadaceae bacterium]
MSDAGPKSSGNKLRAKDALQRKRLRTRLVLLGIGLALFALLSWFWAFAPVSSAPKQLRVAIPSRVSLMQIGGILQREGVIRSGLAFALTARFSGKSLKAGHYKLSSDMTLDQILARMEAGPNDSASDTIRVTIPEGYTLKQIADRLDSKGVTDGREFLRLATSHDGIAQLQADFPLPAETLEGYLFPDTYEFPPHTSPAQVLDAFLMNFSKRFARPYQQEIGRKGLPTLVIEASLIEREAKKPEDRPRIAGVLDNRLQKGMKLEIDATVLYALGHHKSRVTYQDLKVESPYNTYLHPGLPPGAIANPGLSSLLAALNPERS